MSLRFEVVNIFKSVGAASVATKIKVIGDSSAKTSERVKALNGLLGKVGLGLSAAGAVAGITAIAAASLAAARAHGEQELREKVLQAQIEATGRAAGLTAERLGQQASSLQTLTGVADEATLANQAFLISFKNVGEEVFGRTISLAEDMAVVLPSGAGALTQLAKALDQLGAGSTAGLSALRESGTILSDAQVELARSLAVSGRAAEAQLLILREIESQYGGAAAAARDTYAGALKALSAELGDVREDLGSVVASGLRPMVEATVIAARGLKEMELFSTSLKGSITALGLAIPPVGGAMLQLASTADGILELSRSLQEAARAEELVAQRSREVIRSHHEAHAVMRQVMRAAVDAGEISAEAYDEWAESVNSVIGPLQRLYGAKLPVLKAAERYSEVVKEAVMTSELWAERMEELGQAIDKVKPPRPEVVAFLDKGQFKAAVATAEFADQVEELARRWRSLLGTGSLDHLRELARRHIEAEQAALRHQERVRELAQRIQDLRDQVDGLRELSSVTVEDALGGLLRIFRNEVDRLDRISEELRALGLSEFNRSEAARSGEVEAELLESGRAAGEAFIAAAGDLNNLGETWSETWAKMKAEFSDLAFKSGRGTEALAQFAGQMGLLSQQAVQNSQNLAAAGRALGQRLGGGEGAAIGGAVGGVLGMVDLGRTGSSIAEGAAMGNAVLPGWGALVGAFVGWAADAMKTTAEGFADLSTTAEGIVNGAAAGELSGVALEFQNTVNSILGNVLDVLGGTFSEFNRLGVMIREDSEGIRVAWNDQWRNFGDDMAGAIDFAISTILKQTDLAGVSEVASSALQNVAFQTVDELQALIDTVLQIEATGITRFGEGLIAEVKRYNDLLDKAIFEIGAGAEGVLNGPRGLVSSFRTTYNSLFGIGENVGQQRRAEIQALKAQMEMQRAHLLVLKTQIEAEISAAEVRAETTRMLVESQGTVFEATAVGVDGLKLFGRAIGDVAQGTAAAAAVVGGSAASLAAIETALADLDQILETGFSTEAIERAVRQAEAAARGPGPDNSRREQLLFESELARMRVEGASAGEIAAAQFERQMEGLAQTMRESGIDDLVIARRLENEQIQRTLELAQRAASVAQPFENILREDELGELGSRLANLGDQARDGLRQLGDALAEGAPADEIFRQMQTIEEGLAAGIENMLDEALEAAAGDPEALQALRDQLETLLADLPSGLEDVRPLLEEAMASLGADIVVALGDAAREEAQAQAQRSADFAGSASSLGQELEQAVVQWGGTVQLTQQQRMALLELEFYSIQAQLAIRAQQIRDEMAAMEALGLAVDHLAPGLAVLNELALNLAGLEPDFTGLANAAINLGDAVTYATNASNSGAQIWQQEVNATEQFLQQLAQMEEGLLGQSDPMAEIDLWYQQATDRAWELRAGLIAAGTSFEEVTEQLDRIRQLRVHQALEPLRAILEQLRGPGPSGIGNSRDQYFSAQSRFSELVASPESFTIDQAQAIIQEYMAAAEGFFGGRLPAFVNLAIQDFLTRHLGGLGGLDTPGLPGGPIFEGGNGGVSTGPPLPDRGGLGSGGFGGTLDPLSGGLLGGRRPLAVEIGASREQTETRDEVRMLRQRVDEMAGLFARQLRIRPSEKPLTPRSSGRGGFGALAR